MIEKVNLVIHANSCFLWPLTIQKAEPVQVFVFSHRHKHLQAQKVTTTTKKNHKKLIVHQKNMKLRPLHSEKTAL